MARRLFIFAVVVSSAFFVATAGLCVYSCFRGYEGFGVDLLVIRPGKEIGAPPPWVLDQWRISIGVGNARWILACTRAVAADNGDPNPHRHVEYRFNGRWGDPYVNKQWFSYNIRQDPWDRLTWAVGILLPAPLAVVAAGILPAVAIYRRYWRASRKKGCCENCGYDMRASPDRCPECGTIPSISNRKLAPERM
jgi:hypothetical protein